MAKPRGSQIGNFSAVITTCGGPYLRQSISSVLAQTVETECVVVYDGQESDEAYKKIVSDFGPLGVLRIFCTGARGGANAARNLGVRSANGEVIFLLDDDDVFHPRRVESQQLPEALSAPNWLGFCRLVTTGPKAGLVWPGQDPPTSGRLDEFLLGGHRPGQEANFIQTSTLCAPRALLVEHPFDNTRSIHQDLDWLIRVTDAERLVLLFTPDVLVSYTTHLAGSLSTSKPAQLTLDWLVDPNLPLANRLRADGLLTWYVPRCIAQGNRRAAIRCFARWGMRASPWAMISAARHILVRRNR